MKNERFSLETLNEMKVLAGMTLTQLGTQTKVNPSRICLFFRGQHELRPEQEAAIHGALFEAMQIRAAVIGKILHDQKLVLADARGG